MYYDALEHPEKYDNNVVDILRDLVASGRKPTDSERMLLDASVINFSSMPKPKPSPAPKRQSPVPKPMDFKTPDFATEVAAESPEEESGVPLGQPRAFWWV